MNYTQGKIIASIIYRIDIALGLNGYDASEYLSLEKATKMLEETRNKLSELIEEQ